jgi:hypothetical protein
MTKTGLSGWRAAHSITSAGAGQRQSRAEGHHLVAEPCRRICVRNAGGCLAGSIIKPMVESMGLSWQQGPLSISMALSSISSRAQTVVPHGPDRNLDVYEWCMSPVACPRRLRAARKHFRSLSKWSGTWRDCCR